MKKFSTLLLILLMVITCLTACSYECNENTNLLSTVSESEDDDIDDFEESSDFSYDEIALVASYCDYTWDGSIVSNDEHCASIIAGELWIDCKRSAMIPDMGIYENCFWCNVAGVSKNGSCIYDRELGSIEFWDHGTRYQKIVPSFKDIFLTQVYILSNCIIARNNFDIKIYDFNGYNISNLNSVVDCYKKGETLLFSNFEHENFEISENGEIKSLSTHFVRFPRENISLKEDSNCHTIINNLAENLTDELSIIEGKFYLIDFYGDIYENNELVGNINLGFNNTIIKTGPNLLTSNQKSLYIDGKELFVYEGGKKTSIDIPDGDAIFLWHDDQYGTVILIYGLSENDNTLIIVKDNEAKVIAKEVSDANLAYDTLYYMQEGNVYSFEWQNSDAEPELFFEGAYAVSQRTDELEGAIVPSEDNNMKEYGETNLYSPYGSNYE